MTTDITTIVQNRYPSATLYTTRSSRLVGIMYKDYCIAAIRSQEELTLFGELCSKLQADFPQDCWTLEELSAACKQRDIETIISSCKGNRWLTFLSGDRGVGSVANVAEFYDFLQWVQAHHQKETEQC